MAETRRGRETLRDMLLSLGLVFVFIAFLLVAVPRRHYEAVKVVDVASTVQEARTGAPYHLLAPVGLSARWRPTSVRYTPDDRGATAWHIGYVTPADQYAGVEQSDGPAQDFVHVMTQRGLPAGQQTIGAQVWDRFYRETNHMRSLAVTRGGVTTVVAGNAGWDELTTLATALR